MKKKKLFAVHTHTHTVLCNVTQMPRKHKMWWHQIESQLTKTVKYSLWKLIPYVF